MKAVLGLALAALAANLALAASPPPELSGDPLFGLGGRAALGLPMLAGLATWLSAGLLLFLRLRPGPVGAALGAVVLLGLSLAIVEWDLRARVHWFTRPSPYLFWELEPDGVQAPAQKAPGEYRILVLGDSTAWGLLPEDAPPESRFSDVLETRLPGRVRVLNGAAPGYSTYQMAEALRRKYLALEPDCLILGTNSDWTLEGGPDRERLPPEWQRPVLEPLYRLESYLCLKDLVLRYLAPAASGEPRPRAAPEESRRNLVEMIESVQARGGTAILLNLSVDVDHPEFSAAYAPFRREDLAAYQGVLREVARERQVPLVDLFEEWRGEPELLFDPVHPTAEGHRRIAERLFELTRRLPGGA